MAEIIAVCLQKGGTGKTTTAVSLAQAAAFRGYSVLLVDMDGQQDATRSIGGRLGAAGVADLIEGRERAADLIQATEQGIDLIPASPNISGLQSFRGSARRLQSALLPIRGRYDYIVIDSANVPEITLNALQAGTRLVMPVQPDSYSLQAFFQTLKAAKAIRATNPGLDIAGIVFTPNGSRGAYTDHMHGAICEAAERLSVPVLGAVRRSIAVQEAAAFKLSLYAYSRRCGAAKDYLDIMKKIENS